MAWNLSARNDVTLRPTMLINPKPTISNQSSSDLCNSTMKFTTTLSLVPFVLGAGEERIRFGRSMHKRSRKLTAIPNGDGRLDAMTTSNVVMAVDYLPIAPSGFDEVVTSDTIIAIDKPSKIFVQEEQRQLKTPMFSDRLLEVSKVFPEDSMSLRFVDMSYIMSMDFSMAPTEIDTNTSTTTTPPTEVSTGTPPTDVSTGTPSTGITTTVTQPTDVTTTITQPTDVTTTITPPTNITSTSSTGPSTTTTVPTEPISEQEQHFGNMIVSYLKICSVVHPGRNHAHVVASICSL